MKETAQKADLILKNGIIWTSDRNTPYADSVGIKGDRFCFIGRDNETDRERLSALADSTTEVIDLDGRFCMPAILDSHTHLTSIARSSWYLVLTKEQKVSVEAMREALKEYADTHSKEEVPFIYAESCPTDLMDESGIKKEFLDEICSDRPMLLCDANFHRSLVNSCMLELMEISEESVSDLNNIKSYETDEEGHLTGIVEERAFESSLDLMYEKIDWRPPQQDDPDIVKPLLDLLNRYGVIEVTDGFTEGEETFIGLQKLEHAGQLHLYYEGASLVENIDDLNEAIARLRSWQEKYTSRHVHIHNLKLFLDGTNEIGTSALLEPFSNDPEGKDCGILGFSEEELVQIFTRANQEKLDVQIHLVGDRAFRTAIDAVEKAKEICGSTWDVRVTLLHCELTDPEDRKRVAPLGIYINWTPHWSGGCFGMAGLNYLGEERFKRMYCFNDMIRDGAIVNFSSDAVDMEEMERIDPFLGMQIGHTRIDFMADDPVVREPAEETLTMEDLLIGYTINGARGMRLEDDLGSIEEGKIACMLVLNQNPLTVPADRIHETKPELMVFDGKILNK